MRDPQGAAVVSAANAVGMDRVRRTRYPRRQLLRARLSREITRTLHSLPAREREELWSTNPKLMRAAVELEELDLPRSELRVSQARYREIVRDRS